MPRRAFWLCAPFLLALSFWTSVAYADANCDRSVYNGRIAQMESSGGCARGSPGYTCVNTLGYKGKYQFSGDNIRVYGQTDPQTFLSRPDIQEAAMIRFTNQNLAEIRNGPLAQYIGREYRGVRITEEGLMASCHLKGCRGTLNCFQGLRSCQDGYGTDVGKYLDAFSASNCTAGNGQIGAAPSSYRQVCDPDIRSQVSKQIHKSLTQQNEFETASATPPPSNQQLANQPCMSKELKRISDQFAYAPTKWAQQLEGNAMSAAGPASNIMQKMFKSEFESINKAAASVQGMLDFQSMASEVMGDLLESIGLGDAFSSEVCGLMADMLFKYIQCENPIKIPDLPSFKGSLNDLIPNNCAGNALRSTIYEAGNMEALKNMNQRIDVQPGGTFSLVPSHESAHQP